MRRRLAKHKTMFRCLRLAWKTARENIAARFPSAMKNLKIIDNALSAKKSGKGYGFVKVPSKKHVFFTSDTVLMVKCFSLNRTLLQIIKKRRNSYALANQERLIAEYEKRKKERAGTKKRKVFFSALSHYYQKGSAYMEFDIPYSKPRQKSGANRRGFIKTILSI